MGAFYVTTHSHDENADISIDINDDDDDDEWAAARRESIDSAEAPFEWFVLNSLFRRNTPGRV